MRPVRRDSTRERPNRMAIAPTSLFFLKQMPHRRKYRKLQNTLTMVGKMKLEGVKTIGDSAPSSARTSSILL